MKDAQFAHGDVSASGGIAVRVTEGRPAAMPVTASGSDAQTRKRRLGDRSRGSLTLLLLVADLLAVAFARTLSPTALQPTLTAMVVMLVLFSLTGRYRALRLDLSVVDDLPCIVAVAIIGYAPSLTARDISGAPVSAALVGQAVLLAGGLTLFRAAAYLATRRGRRSVGNRTRTLILGSGKVGCRLARALKEHPSYGFEVVGFVDSHPRTSRGGVLPLPVLGPYERLPAIIEDVRASCIIVAYGGRGEADLVDVVRTVDRLAVDVAVVPRLYELHSERQGVEEIRGVPIVWARRHGPRRASWRAKRVFDVVIALTAMLLLAPLLAAVALAVRLEGGPGLLFRQQRVGLDGRPFELLKFRSLRPATEVESQTMWNVSLDARLSRFGSFLRRTSIDELPQLWNVLMGEMSVVGPRPERPFFVDQFSTQFRGYPARHRVPAGLTGWAQVHGLRGDTSIEERAVFDNYYIENWSLWLDLKILVKTLGQVVGRRGG